MRAWEQLVTEGHVRAARFRSAEPIVMAIALILIAVGFFMIQKAPRLSVSSGGATGAAEEQIVRGLWTPVYSAFAAMPAPIVDAATAKSLAPARELEAVATLMLTSLNEKQVLPSELPIKTVSKEDFWRKPWAPLDLTVVREPDLIVMGAVVDLNPGIYAADLRRWMGVFRKRPDGRWVLRSITYEPVFVTPTGDESVSQTAAPFEVAFSLKKVLP